MLRAHFAGGKVGSGLVDRPFRWRRLAMIVEGTFGEELCVIGRENIGVVKGVGERPIGKPVQRDEQHV